jgi:hypothetical protein
MTAPDQPTLEHLPDILNDAYVTLYKARALITVVGKFGFLHGNHQEEEEPMHPTDVGFLMGVVLDLIKEAFDELEGLEGFLNTIRHHRGHPVEGRAVWAYLRRLWAHGDKADQAPILRCAKVLDGRPHFRSAVEHLLHKLEERVMPEQHPFFFPSPMAGGNTEKPDA